MSEANTSTSRKRSGTVIPTALSEERSSDPSLLATATTLGDAGWNLVPVTSVPTRKRPNENATKNPGGLLGTGWQKKSSSNPRTLQSWFSESHATLNESDPTKPDIMQVGVAEDTTLRQNCYRSVPFESIGLAIHVGDDAVVLDIDEPDNLPEEFWAELNTAPFHSTSSRDPRRGHYFFKIRDGFSYGQTSSLPDTTGNGSPGEVRHGNAIVAVSPTVHPKAHLQRRYKWIRGGELPIMSEKLAAYCQKKTRSRTWNGTELVFGEASPEELENYYEATCTNSLQPEIIDQHLIWLGDQADKFGLHAKWLPGLIDLLQIAASGYFPGEDAVIQAEARFISIRTDQARAQLGGNVTDEDTARKEHDDMVRWALGRITAKIIEDRDATNYESYRIVQQYYWDDAPEIVMPSSYLELPPSRVHRSWYHPKEVITDDGRELVDVLDRTITQRMARHIEGKLVWVDDLKQWMQWNENTKLWFECSENLIVSHTIPDIYEKHLAATSSMHFTEALRKFADPDLLEVLTRLYGPTQTWVRLSPQLGTFSKRVSIEKDLRGIPTIARHSDQFDVLAEELAVQNGMINVRTREFRERTSDDLFTKCLPTAYDHTATCSKFTTMLAGICQPTNERDLAVGRDIAALIQRFLGSSMIGSDMAGKHPGMLYVYGVTGSGKSLVFNVIMSTVLGKSEEGGLYSSLSNEVFRKNAKRDALLSSVAGSRLLVSNELPPRRLDGEFIKEATDGSRVAMRKLYGQPFYKPLGRIVTLSNNEISLDYWDSAMQRRLNIVCFDHTLDVPEDVMEQLAPEFSGILNWILDGAADFLRMGFNAPTYVRENTLAAIGDASPPAEFIRSTFEIAPAGMEEAFQLDLADVVALYMDWAKINGITLPEKPSRGLIDTFEAMLPGAVRRSTRTHGDKRMWLSKELVVSGEVAPADKYKTIAITSVVAGNGAMISSKGSRIIGGAPTARLGRDLVQRHDVNEWLREHPARGRSTFLNVAKNKGGLHLIADEGEMHTDSTGTEHPPQ